MEEAEAIAYSHREPFPERELGPPQGIFKVPRAG